jgi:ABC-type multidrug transport system ATPase subunit
MKQKLALCCALIHNPDILFLDEPTTGVDAVSRKEFWEMLKKLKSQGITILVSTPYMDEAILCDRVALIQEGSVMSIDKPVDIVDRFKRPIYNFQSDDNYKLLIHLRTIPEIHSAFAFGDSIHVVSQTGIELEHINSKLINAGFQDVKINSTVANIEDCFMDLMLSQHHE